MPYLSNGNVVDKKNYWKLSTIPELFWGILNFIHFFFASVFKDPTVLKKSQEKKRQGFGFNKRGGGDGGGGGRPLGRPGRRGGINNVRAPMGGG